MDMIWLPDTTSGVRMFFFFFHFYNHQFIAKYQWKVKMTAFDHVKPCSTMTLPPFSLQEN